MFGIVWMYNKVMNTPSMIVGPSTILLQPHVGGFHASDLDFLPTLRQVWPSRGGISACRCYNSRCLALLWMYNKVMNTPSMIVGPSTILFTAPCWRVSCLRSGKKSRFSANSQTSLAIKWGYISMQVL